MKDWPTCQEKKLKGKKRFADSKRRQKEEKRAPLEQRATGAGQPVPKAKKDTGGDKGGNFQVSASKKAEEKRKNHN